MNDDKIREILNSTHEKIVKPTNEWSELVKRIDERKSSIFFSWKAFSAIALSCFMLLGINLYRAQQGNNSLEFNDQLIVQDLSEISDYLNTDSESIYAWVE